MKFLLGFNQLNESKQVGILYHVTRLSSFHEIVNNDFNFSSNYNGNKIPTISFTRKSKGDFMPTIGRMVRFTIDGDKLSQNFKLIPYSDYKRGYGRKEYSSGKDEAETILISKPFKNKPGYGEPINLKPYIIRIDIIYHDMFGDDFDAEREFLEKIDIPIFIHKDTYDSTHEFPIIQKNKSKFKELNSIQKKGFLLPKAEELFKLLKQSNEEDLTNDNTEYIDSLRKNNSIGYCGNIEYAKKFKTIEDMANQLIKYDVLINNGNKRFRSKYACKEYNGRYIAYKD